LEKYLNTVVKKLVTTLLASYCQGV